MESPESVAVDAIRWPEEFEPRRCPIHVRNELEMPVAADRVWTCLVRAEVWPSWYANWKNVRFVEGDPPDLAMGARFRWRTFGVTVDSRVREFEPTGRIAWDAAGIGVRAYHAWLIRETPTGCVVLTEETQHGWLALLGAALMPMRMSHFHQVWLECLRDRAVSGMPQARSIPISP